MRKKVIRFFILICLVTSGAYAEELPELPKGPLLLTSVTSNQLNADYWINRLPDPDLPVKTAAELKYFNEEIHAMIPERVNIFKMDVQRKGKPIRDQLEFEFNTVRRRILFDVNDQRIPKTIFYEKLRQVSAWENVPDRISVIWGAAVRATSVRALPTDIKMLEEMGDVEFDQLQYTQIKLWTPVGIYHVSGDGRWYYLQAPYVRGWVRAEDIAIFNSREELKKMAKPVLDFLVVTGESVPVYSDPALTRQIQRASMGTILPLAEFETARERLEGKSKNYQAIWLPERGPDGTAILQKAYLDSKADLSKGYLPLTQRNIIKQAFKLLGARYGWGGQYNGRDCSGFTHDVFLSLGVDMPRDSKQQSLIGTQLGHFQKYQNAEEKIAAIKAGAPAITLFKMPLHMMLYLGEVNGKFYVIHSTWAERISQDSDEKNRINQVVVSDLSLNGNSYLGSLFDRIITINELN